MTCCTRSRDSHDYVLDESRSNLTDVCDEEYVEVLVCANCGDELVTRYTVEHDTVFHVVRSERIRRWMRDLGTDL